LTKSIERIIGPLETKHLNWVLRIARELKFHNQRKQELHQQNVRWKEIK